MAEGDLRGCPVTGPAPERLPRPRGPLHALRCNQRGTALVEFALIAPLLFLLIFGIVDFGRALDYYNQLTQLAGQGARAAAVNRNPDGTALSSSNHFSIQQQLATTYTTQPELRNGVVVCITHVPTGTQDYVTVKTSYQLQIPAAGRYRRAALRRPGPELDPDGARRDPERGYDRRHDVPSWKSERQHDGLLVMRASCIGELGIRGTSAGRSW